MLPILLGFLVTLVSSQNFYITFHGGSSGYNNIGVYSKTGTSLGNLLSTEAGHDSLRGLAYHSSEDLLYICSAKDNTIVTASGCGNSPSLFSNDKKLDHPYGVDIDVSLSRMYVSNQNGDNVVYFTLNNSVKTGRTKVFAWSVPNPRGIAVDPATSDVYVASEDAKAVFVFDKNGQQKNSIPIDIPVGVYVNGGLVYISNRGDNPATYSFNMTTGEKLITYKSTDSHPTGMVVSSGILYVLGQTNQQLNRYDLQTGAYLGPLITFTDDYPEQILFGPCQN